FLRRRTDTMLLSCSPSLTRSLASRESEELRVVGPIRFKEIVLMIPNLIARRSKKGDKADPGQASHGSRQRLGKDTLVCRANPVLAASVSKTEDARGEVSFDP